jgi:hypothetical protein
MPSSESVHPDIHKLLEQVALQKGMTIDQAVLEWKNKYGKKAWKASTDPERKANLNRVRRHAGAVQSGDPHSADNDRIDADLAAEYQHRNRMDR